MMDRRFLLQAGILGLAGCRLKPKQYDPTPDRIPLIESNWKGNNFDHVEATYELSITSKNPRLSRTPTGQPIELAAPLEGTTSAPALMIPAARIQPTSARVELVYWDRELSSRVREIRATLFWPTNDHALDSAHRVHSETRMAPLYFESMVEFLDRSGGLRVDDEQPYFAYESTWEAGYKSDYSPSIWLLIEGPTEGSRFERRIAYKNGNALYQFVHAAWPELTVG